MTGEMRRELVRQLFASEGWKAVQDHLQELQEQEARSLLTKRVEGAEAALVALTQAQEAIRCYKKVQNLKTDDVIRPANP